MASADADIELQATRRLKIRPVLSLGLGAGWAGWGLCELTTVLIATYDVETALVMGPIILLVGVLIVVLALIGGYSLMGLLGGAYCGACVLPALLIAQRNWSPGQAEGPLAFMGLVFTVGSLPLVIAVTRRVPRYTNPWRCAGCGYLLYGLREPRCPECGTPFDAALLEGGGADTRAGTHGGCSGRRDVVD